MLYTIDHLHRSRIIGRETHRGTLDDASSLAVAASIMVPRIAPRFATSTAGWRFTTRVRLRYDPRASVGAR